MVAPVDLQGISVNQVAQTCPDVPSKDLPAGDPVTWSSFEGWNIIGWLYQPIVSSFTCHSFIKNRKVVYIYNHVYIYIYIYIDVTKF